VYRSVLWHGMWLQDRLARRKAGYLSVFSRF